MNKSLTILVLCMLAFINIDAQTFGSYTDQRDDKTYKTIKIGDKIWMAENLKFWSDKNSPDFKGLSYYYEGLNENYHRYGRLYSWEVANEVCPEGWHLPSMAEWFSLINSFGDIHEEDYKTPTLKGLMKKIPKEERKSRKKMAREIYEALMEGGASGFDVLYAGYRDPHAFQGVSLGTAPGYYSGLGTIASYWSSGDNVEKGMFKKNKAEGFQFRKNGKKFYAIPIGKDICCSIRCVKDD